MSTKAIRRLREKLHRVPRDSYHGNICGIVYKNLIDIRVNPYRFLFMKIERHIAEKQILAAGIEVLCTGHLRGTIYADFIYMLNGFILLPDSQGTYWLKYKRVEVATKI